MISFHDPGFLYLSVRYMQGWMILSRGLRLLLLLVHYALFPLYFPGYDDGSVCYGWINTIRRAFSEGSGSSFGIEFVSPKFGTFDVGYVVLCEMETRYLNCRSTNQPLLEKPALQRKWVGLFILGNCIPVRQIRLYWPLPRYFGNNSAFRGKVGIAA